jgi:hypothetical protein
MPVILATWEAEIQRMWIKVSLGKKFTRPHLNRKKLRINILLLSQ